MSGVELLIRLGVPLDRKVVGTHSPTRASPRPCSADQQTRQYHAAIWTAVIRGQIAADAGASVQTARRYLVFLAGRARSAADTRSGHGEPGERELFGDPTVRVG